MGKIVRSWDHQSKLESATLSLVQLMVTTHRGPILAFAARVVAMAPWKEVEIVQVLRQDMAEKIAHTLGLQKKLEIVTYFLVQSMVIFLLGQYSLSVARVVEMGQKQELEIVQILLQNMGAESVL